LTRLTRPKSDPDLERIAALERSCRTRSVSANYADPISQHKRVYQYRSRQLPTSRRIIKGRPFEVASERDPELYREEQPYEH
jgi:hypothetical protein